MKSTLPKSPKLPKNGSVPPPSVEGDGKAEDQNTGNNATPRRGPANQHGKQLNLEESEARYRRLFETAKDGILILDGDTGRIVDANPFLQDMLGYSESELIGKALWEIGAVRDIPASQQAMRELQKNEYIRYEDIPLETKTGGRKHVEFVSNVYLVSGRKVIQCNIRDITERKDAEARVLETKDKLLVLVSELQWRDRQMQLMNRMNELLQSCITQDEAYQVITLCAADLFPGRNGSLAILPVRNEKLSVVARWGAESIMQSNFALEDCWALRLGQIHEVIDQDNSLLCRHFMNSPPGGYFCLPLTVQGETLGVLSLINNTIQTGEHPPGLKQLAVSVGETIKFSLSNLKLRDELRSESIHDPLTGLFNRRYLDETLSRDLYQVERRNDPLCVVMLDLDGLKRLNDSLGHSTGDSVLRLLGHTLQEHLRKSDISCRYGGDEFVLVLPDSSIAETKLRVEQLGTVMKRFQQDQRGQDVGPITLSAGIAQAPEHGKTARELLQAADQAMYAAKQAGGDRIVIYRGESVSDLRHVAQARTP